MCSKCETSTTCACDGGSGLAMCACEQGRRCPVCEHEADAQLVSTSASIEALTSTERVAFLLDAEE